MGADYWTGEPEPPRYTCAADSRVVHEGDEELEDCPECLPVAEAERWSA